MMGGREGGRSILSITPSVVEEMEREVPYFCMLRRSLNPPHNLLCSLLATWRIRFKRNKGREDIPPPSDSSCFISEYPSSLNVHSHNSSYFFSPLFYFFANPHKPYCLASLLLTYIKEMNTKISLQVLWFAVLYLIGPTPPLPPPIKYTFLTPHLISKYVRRDAETTSLRAVFLGLGQSV